jgi:hypothetical protein
MINADGAQVYFGSGSHPESATWTKFEATAQAAAIVQARRDIATVLRRALDESEATYAEGDVYREEFAVYEQALHIAKNTVFPNEEGTGAAFLGVDPEMGGEVRQRDPQRLAPAALRWLTVGKRIKLVRG